MGPLQENSDPNPRSCWFLREGYPGPQCTRGPHRPPPLPWANPSYVPAPRPCVYSLRVPHFAKKRKVLLPRSFLTHFYTLITMSLTEIQNSKKLSAISTWRFWNIMGEQKRKVRQFRKMGLIDAKWHKDSKSGLRIQIKPHLTKLLAKNGWIHKKSENSQDFLRFWPFIANNLVKCYPIWIVLCVIWRRLDLFLSKLSHFDFLVSNYISKS